MPPPNQLQKIIQQSDNIVFFGGAGVSTESGIPDFRSVDGLYNMKYPFPPETILSHTFFEENPEAFYRFYRDKLIFPEIKPNKAHLALAALEKMGKLRAIITQNIDGLHQMAGSQMVYELHGSGQRFYCCACKKTYTPDILQTTDNVPMCDCGGIIRPDIVLFEEPLDDLVFDAAIHTIECADVLVIGGTSLNVYPAAGLVHHFNGKSIVLINQSHTEFDTQADIVIRTPIAEALSTAVHGLI